MSNSLIDLSSIGEPAKILIEKISNAIGWIAQPIQMKRLAQAEIEIEKMRFDARRSLENLNERAMLRSEADKIRRQNNVEAITLNALPLLQKNIDPQAMDDDWIFNFFKKSENTSSPEMQILWSRILAGEANKAGTFSKRTVNAIEDFSKKDAKMFTDLCAFVATSSGELPLIFDSSDAIYNDGGINFGVLSHLKAIGLIDFNSLSGFMIKVQSNVIYLQYFERRLKLTRESPIPLNIGQVLLTAMGSELAPICGSIRNDKFEAYLIQKFSQSGYLVEME